MPLSFSVGAGSCHDSARSSACTSLSVPWLAFSPESPVGAWTPTQILPDQGARVYVQILPE